MVHLLRFYGKLKSCIPIPFCFAYTAEISFLFPGGEIEQSERASGRVKKHACCEQRK